MPVYRPTSAHCRKLLVISGLRPRSTCAYCTLTISLPGRSDCANSQTKCALSAWSVCVYISRRGALAQLGERLVCNQEVAGSIPVRSIQVQKKTAPDLAPFFASANAGLENGQIVEAHNRVTIALQGSVIERAFGAVHELGDVDLRHGEIRDGGISGTQADIAADRFVFGGAV